MRCLPRAQSLTEIPGGGGVSWRVLGPRSGGTTGAALGQGLGLSSMTSATGPQARLRAQAITNLGPIYWNDPSWLFGILGDLHYASPSSLTTGSSACEQDICSCFLAAVVCPRTTSKAFQFLGLGCGLSEGGSLPSGVGGVSSKAAASIFVPSIAVPSRPPRSFWISQIYRSSVPLSLSLSSPPRQ